MRLSRFFILIVLLFSPLMSHAESVDFFFRQLQIKNNDLQKSLNSPLADPKNKKEILSRSGILLQHLEKNPDKDLDLSPLEYPVATLHRSLAKNEMKIANAWADYVSRFPALNFVMAYRRAGLGHEQMLAGEVHRADDHYLAVKKLLDDSAEKLTSAELSDFKKVEEALEKILAITRRDVLMTSAESTKALKNLRKALITLSRHAEKSTAGKAKK